MKKIPTLLVRDPNNRSKVLDEINPGCEWVLAGEGVATRKFDGTCVKKDETGIWWARREVKPGKDVPYGYILEDYDQVTGKSQGWEPVKQSPFYKFWKEALENNPVGIDEFTQGTYELIGPKINGDPEHAGKHLLVPHGIFEWRLSYPAKVYQIKDFVFQLGVAGIEGIVWHHPDGRMAKLKYRDLKEN